MPIHDWTRVSAGTWHAFHLSWISAIREVLNSGLLPGEVYAQAEQIAGPIGPDVLVLEACNGQLSDGASKGGVPSGGVTLATKKPPMRLNAEAEMDDYALKRRTIVIRHSSDDRIIALIEMVSPGNKSSTNHFRAFIDKAVESLYRGFHLLIIDMFPPTKRDPNGIHGAVWGEFNDDQFVLPKEDPLTLVSYSAGQPKKAYIEPTRVGNILIDMPVFLDPDYYVNVPLESTYQAAWRGMPRKYQQILEAPRS